MDLGRRLVAERPFAHWLDCTVRLLGFDQANQQACVLLYGSTQNRFVAWVGYKRALWIIFMRTFALLFARTSGQGHAATRLTISGVTMLGQPFRTLESRGSGAGKTWYT